MAADSANGLDLGSRVQRRRDADRIEYRNRTYVVVSEAD
ncbi:hypothetical protein FHT76_007859 [Rhizobium sp. BK176]|nr:hypothetical protein [Rhizobium sp. BK181]MBB3541093.1 hypothetical protein [Rhizobium sp. BK399]MCS3743787.1 hypothetical protein [Rhizobium sp. BK661]MCS4096138.1 hypothetical protein [Rhizobium sp. BK176]